jgi:O-antigen ligase
MKHLVPIKTISRFVYITIVLIYVFPLGVMNLYNISSEVNILQWFADVVLVLLSVLVSIKDKSFVKCSVDKWIWAFVSVLLGSTILNHGDIWRTITMSAHILGCVIYTKTGSRLFKKRFYIGVSRLFAFLAIVNLTMMIISPNFFGQPYAYRRYLFISNDNSILPFLISGFGLAYTLKQKDGGRASVINQIICFAIYSPAVFLSTSETSKIVFLAIGFLLLMYELGLKRILNIRIIICIIALFTVLCLNGTIPSLLSGTYSTGASTFSGRPLIWSESLAYISESPIIGHGMQPDDLLFDIGSNRMFSSHNMYLQIMGYGGGMLLVAFLGIILSSIRHVSLRDNRNIGYFAMCVGILLYYIFEVHIDLKALCIVLVMISLDNGRQRAPARKRV